jgi:hypothetical protein
MFKRSIKPLAFSAFCAVTLASAATQAPAQQHGGIVYQQAAYEAPGYCHIKYMAFTEESLQTGQLEFDQENIIDRYGDCSFDPTSPEEVQRQMSMMNRTLFNDSESNSD